MTTNRDKFTKKRCKPIMKTTTKRYKTIKERQKNNCKDKNNQLQTDAELPKKEKKTINETT